MTINDSTLNTDIFKAIRSLLVSGLTNVSVNTSYSDKTPSRPQVVISSASPSETFDKFGGTEGRKNINIALMIYGQTPLAADTLSDQVKVLIKQNNINGIDLISMDEDTAFDINLEDKFHSKTLSITYLRE